MKVKVKVKRAVHLVVNGTDNADTDTDTDTDRRRCPRCGGRLEPNAGGPGDAVLFAASPREELCMRCLTGHDADWAE